MKFAIVSLILTLVSLARAEEFVLIVIPSGDNIDYSAFENRLRSELTAAGYSTLTASLPSPIDPATLPAHANRFATNICVSVSISDTMVIGFVSVVEPASGKSVIRPVPGCPIAEQAPSIFAVRATDVLHGILLELNYRPSATQKPSKPESGLQKASDAREPAATPRDSKGDAPSPRESKPAHDAKPIAVLRPSAIPSKDRHWGVSLGVAFTGSTHDHTLPIAPGGQLGVFLKERYWGLCAEGSAYLPVAVSFHDSRITANQWLAGASFELYQPLAPAFSLFELVGLGAYRISVSGAGAGRATGLNASDTLGYFRAGVGLVSDFDERTALALRLGVLAPWSVVDIVAREAAGAQTVAQLKFPVMLGDLGLRVAF